MVNGPDDEVFLVPTAPLFLDRYRAETRASMAFVLGAALEMMTPRSGPTVELDVAEIALRIGADVGKVRRSLRRLVAERFLAEPDRGMFCEGELCPVRPAK